MEDCDVPFAQHLGPRGGESIHAIDRRRAERYPASQPRRARDISKQCAAAPALGDFDRHRCHAGSRLLTEHLGHARRDPRRLQPQPHHLRRFGLPRFGVGIDFVFCIGRAGRTRQYQTGARTGVGHDGRRWNVHRFEEARNSRSPVLSDTRARASTGYHGNGIGLEAPSVRPFAVVETGRQPSRSSTRSPASRRNAPN